MRPPATSRVVSATLKMVIHIIAIVVLGLMCGSKLSVAVFAHRSLEGQPDGLARMCWTGITYFVVRPKWIRYSDFYQNP